MHPSITLPTRTIDRMTPPQQTRASHGQRITTGGASRNGRTVAMGLAGVAAFGALAIAVTARRKRISVAALLVNAAAGLLAPDLDGPKALERAIAQDRARGPAPPPKALRRTMRFTDERVAGVRQFRLNRSEGRPAAHLLYLHGGAYVFGVQAMQWAIVGGLLKHVAADIVALLYPLAPEHGWEDSVTAAEASFRALAARVGARNIAIVGDSAGGGLALLLAQRLRDAGADLPAALVLISPWLDIGCSADDQPALEARDPALSIAFLRTAGRLWGDALPPDDPRVSPLFGDHAGLPPTIMFSGGRDVLASDAFRLAERNPAIVHRHSAEMIHDWPIAPIPEGRRALEEAAAFIMAHIPRGMPLQRSP